MKTAIITGVAGQDGSYLSEYLLKNNYTIYGISRRKSTSSGLKNLKNSLNSVNFNLIEGDLSDSTFMSRLVMEIKPHEFYNLGAQSHVGHSFKNPIESFRTNAESVIMHLSFIKDLSPYTRYYQASTSEMFGGTDCPASGYDESSKLNPRSPYAIAKVAAHHSVVNYRKAYGIYAVSGILFNHSSPRRGYDFATRKITSTVAKIKLGKEEFLHMGNLKAFRDEGHSKDYVEAMHMMLNNNKPTDYVVSTGDGATIEDMLKYTCNLANLNPNDIYKMNKKFMRPSDVPYLKGNSSKITTELGWKPRYSWRELLKDMYDNDLLRNT